MKKFMVLTGSDGNPRSFPSAEVVELEETYPYLLRKYFNNVTFWQLSFGGDITASKLLGQPTAYLTHWHPDIIIVQSGMVDCRPEGFSEFQKELISQFTWKFFGKIKKYIYHPEWIRRRQLHRVSPSSFRTTIKRFKLIFPKSKILWLEICAGTKYEDARPGLNRRMVQYNEIIKSVYGDNFIPLQQKMLAVDGFNASDHVHWNKRGHAVAASILIEKILVLHGQ